MSDPALGAEIPGQDERERLLIEAVVTLARTLRDERDRLASRLDVRRSEGSQSGAGG